MIGRVEVALSPHFDPTDIEYLKPKSDILSVELGTVWRAENGALMQLHGSAEQWSLFIHSRHISETHNAYINSTHSINANVFSKVRLHATESKVTSLTLSQIDPKIQYSNVRYSCSLPHFEFRSPSLYCSHLLTLVPRSRIFLP
jgi:hypothetical protein